MADEFEVKPPSHHLESNYGNKQDPFSRHQRHSLQVDFTKVASLCKNNYVPMVSEDPLVERQVERTILRRSGKDMVTGQVEILRSDFRVFPKSHGFFPSLETMLLEFFEIFTGQVKTKQAVRAVVRQDDDVVLAGHFRNNSAIQSAWSFKLK